MTALQWDFGSAYDFFISLFVIHHPDRFGLRAAWAAGVRSRLCTEDRQFLEETLSFLPVPLMWIYHLPIQEKNTLAVLDSLAAISPGKRLQSLFRSSLVTDEVIDTIERIQSKQDFSPADLEVLRTVYQNRITPIKTRDVRKFAEAFFNPAEYGEKLLHVLKVYYQVFFAEEEERILQAVKESLVKAQDLAESLPIPQLLETLSNGVKVENIETYQKVTLAPSYWSSPLNFFNPPENEEMLVVFGCREETQNLIPGEYVPEALVMGLKALGDPTRLRILYYLNHGSASPSSLARQLRLRAPTVIHHLNTLRLAGLVQVTLASNGDRRYSLRQGSIEDTYQLLNKIIKCEK